MKTEDLLSMIKESLFEVAPTRRSEFESVELSTAISELKLDSIAVMEMVGCLEDRIDITFPDEELNQVKSLGDLANLALRESVQSN